MNWVDQTLADFGRSLGISGLLFDDKGVAQLRMQSGMLLAVERLEEEILIYCAHMLVFESDALKLRALKRANFRNGNASPIQLGLKGVGMEAQLIILTRIRERDFTLQTLGQSFDYLCSWYDGI